MISPNAKLTGKIKLNFFVSLRFLLLILCLVSLQSAAERAIISGKFTPTGQQQLMIIGQDSDTISEYLRDVPEDPVEGVTLYTMVKHADPRKTLKGVFSPGDWQSGEVSYGKTLAEDTGLYLAVGLAFDDCNDVDHSLAISNGQYDKTLTTLAKYFASIAPRKVLLRAGYEFDGLWNCYDPDTYINAFRRVTDIMRKEASGNVAMVWQSAAWPAPEFAGERTHLYDHRDPDHLQKWYPGDDYVDWIGVSVFYRDLQQFNFPVSITPDKAQQLYLDFAREKQKPLLVAEAAPQAYRTEKQTRSFIAHNKQTPHSAQDIWKDWYQPFFDFIYANNDVIRAVAYINAHWESQSRWYCAPDKSPPSPECPEGNWGDSRVQGHPYIKQMWLKEVNNADRWVQAEMMMESH